jgi:hypothetical protein
MQRFFQFISDFEIIRPTVLFIEDIKIFAGESDATETVIALGHILAHHKKGTVGTVGTFHAIGHAVAADTLCTVGQVRGVLTMVAIGAFVAAIALFAEDAIGASGAISQPMPLIVYGICLKLVFQFFQLFFKIFYIHGNTSHSDVYRQLNSFQTALWACGHPAHADNWVRSSPY